MLVSVTENRNVNTLSSQIFSPHIIHTNWLVPEMVVVIYLFAVQKINFHWFRIAKHFGYRLTSIFVGARRFTTPFRQKDMSDEELYDIFSLLYTLYLVLVSIQITTHSINTPKLIVLESRLNGISLAVLDPIYIFLDHRCPMHPMR